MKENKIDQLFRKGLQEAEIPFEEAHWRDMKNRLEYQGRRRKDIILWTSIGGVAAMFLMTIAWWITAPVVKNPVKDAAENISSESMPAKEQSTAQNISDGVLVEKSTPIRTDLPENIVKSADPINYPVSVYTQTKPEEVNSNVTNVAAEDKLPATEQRAAENPPVNNEPVLAAAGSTQNVQADLIQKAQLPADSQRVTQKKSGFRPQLILSVTSATDVNAVNSFSESKTGFNGGLLATLTLSRRISVTSGAVMAKKIYETPFSNYKPNSSYVFPVSPYDVLADCRVLDIPLNVNYAVINKGNNRFGISAGLSSYLMLKEHYDFKYQNPAVRYPRSYGMRGRNQHYFGVANFAVSYEKKLNNNAGISLQPFVKVPLTDIGYGNVKLLSAGISANLNINISTISGRNP